MTDLGYRCAGPPGTSSCPRAGDRRPEPLPAGFTVRDAAEADHEAAWTLLEDAFLEWSERDRTPLDDFGSRIWERPGLRSRGTSGWWRTPTASSSVPPTCTSPARPGTSPRSPYVPTTAGAGWPAPMLVDAFGLAREHGATRCYLSTDTRAGARGLYEKVGMVVASTWVNRAIEL